MRLCEHEDLERRASMPLLMMYNSQLASPRLRENERKRLESRRQRVIAILGQRGDLPETTGTAG